MESDLDLPESRTVVQTATIYVKKKKKKEYVHTYTYVSEHADQNRSGLLTVAVSGEGNGRKGTNISLCIL